MEKEFVTYNQALALKELCFDEPCMGVYYGDEDDMQFVLDVRETQYYAQNGYKDGILAPTFSQVFRWFRNEHKLNHWIDLNFRTEKYILQIWRGRECLLNNHSIKTYEEAESACIDKLIELVKQGK